MGFKHPTTEQQLSIDVSTCGGEARWSGRGEAGKEREGEKGGAKTNDSHHSNKKYFTFNWELSRKFCENFALHVVKYCTWVFLSRGYNISMQADHVILSFFCVIHSNFSRKSKKEKMSEKMRKLHELPYMSCLTWAALHGNGKKEWLKHGFLPTCTKKTKTCHLFFAAFRTSFAKIRIETISENTAP